MHIKYRPLFLSSFDLVYIVMVSISDVHIKVLNISSLNVGRKSGHVTIFIHILSLLKQIRFPEIVAV